MRKVIGYLKNLVGKYFAKESDGHLREIYPGDPVYESERVVNADGIMVPDALHSAKSHDPDAAGAEANVEAGPGDARWREEQPTQQRGKESQTSGEEPAPKQHDELPRPTVSTDEFEESYAETNIVAALRRSDFFRENVGLVRTPGLEEVDVNAPLRREQLFEEERVETAQWGGGHPSTAPTATDDAARGVPGQSVTVDVVSNDSDPENDLDPTTVRIVDGSGNSVTSLTVSGEGKWSVDPQTGAITFEPENGFTGDPAPIEYTVKDKTGLESNRATVTVDYDVPPVATDDSSTHNTPGNAVTVDVLVNDSDADGTLDVSSVRLIDGGGNPVTTLSVPNEGIWSVDTSTGKITFTPDVNFHGDPTPVEYTVEDDEGNVSNRATVTVDYDVPPVADDDSAMMKFGESITLNIISNDSDSDGNINAGSVNLDASSVNGVGTDTDGDGDVDKVVVSGEGTWTVDGNGNLTFAPESGFFGDPTPIDYTVKDDEGNLSNEATVTVLMDNDGDGVPDKDDIDDDNDGILDADECSGQFDGSGPEYVWGHITDLNSGQAEGYLDGVHFTYVSVSSGGRVEGTDSYWYYQGIPSEYGVPNGDGDGDAATDPILKVSRPRTYTITFDDPIDNPVLVFTSLGNAPSHSNYVAENVIFSDPVEVLYRSDWSVNGKNVDIISPTEIEGSDGVAVVRFNGTFTQISFDYTEFESYTNLGIGRYDGGCDDDGDGIPNIIDIDADNDGIVDNVEAQSTTAYIAPLGVDTDGDGLDDAYDPDNGGTPISPVDTDGDSRPDYLDLDSDNDYKEDALEGWDSDGDGTADVVPGGTDTDNDGLDDAYDNDTSTMNPTNGTVPTDYPDTEGLGDQDWRAAAIVDGDETVTIDEDTSVSGDLFDNLRDGDSTDHTLTSAAMDIDGDGTAETLTLENDTTITDANGDPIGTIRVNSDGTYTFTPATNWNGTVPTVTYTMVDDNDPNDTDTSTLDITVNAVTDPLVDGNEGDPDPLIAHEGTALLGNLLDNVSDPDSDDHSVKDAGIDTNGDGVVDVALTLDVATDVQDVNGDVVGTITVSSDGSYEFLSAPNYHGDVPTVIYTVQDNNDPNDTDTSTLDITAELTLCKPAFYQVMVEDIDGDGRKDDSYLKILNSDGSYTELARFIDYGLNATGFNLNDGKIYGFSGWNLVSIDATGTIEKIGWPEDQNGDPLKMGSGAGDMDENGYLYIRPNNNDNNGNRYGYEDIVKIDVANNTFEVIDFNVVTGVEKVSDLVLIGDTLYGLDYQGTSPLLYVWDLTNQTLTTHTVSGALPTGAYGAGWTDMEGRLYFASNASGGVYEITGFDTASPGGVWIADSDAIKTNDGVSCPTMPAPFTDLDGDGINNTNDEDTDGDGIMNIYEVYGDADGDRIRNTVETDSDGDGIADNIEAQALGYIAASGNDADGNGVDDAYDADRGGTKILPTDTDGDGVYDYVDPDTLVYNGSGAIDGDLVGGTVVDSVVLMAGVDLDFGTMGTIPFDNIETLDLRAGDHTLEHLTWSDVIDMTDGNNDLVIEGESGDTVKLTGGDWSGGTVQNGYAEYTNSNDQSILLKVSEEVHVLVA